MIHNLKTFEIFLTNHKADNKKMTIYAYSSPLNVLSNVTIAIQTLGLTTYDHEIATAYQPDKHHLGKKNYHYLFNRKLRSRYGFGKTSHGGVICHGYL